MAEIIRFDQQKARRKTAKAKGNTLCSNGFHKWAVYQDKQFDVKQGKLVTIYRCQRCAAQKVKTL